MSDHTPRQRRQTAAHDDTHCWLALYRTPGLGSRGLLKLLTQVDSPTTLFKASHEQLKVLGLSKDSIDYLVTTTLVKTLEGQGGKGRDELAGIPIPVRVTGPLAKPSYRPDLEAALSAKAKQEVQKKVEEKLQDKVGDVLKGLFK